MVIVISYLFMMMVYNVISTMGKQLINNNNMFKYKIKLKSKLELSYQMIINQLKDNVNI